MAKNENFGEIMKVSYLQAILAAILLETGDDYQIWLASDEEGNNIIPMHSNMLFSVSVDKDSKQVIFFPQH